MDLASERLPGPAGCRRLLRMQLRQLRERAGMTQEFVAEQLDWSPAKIMRIEAGSSGISTSDLRAFVQLLDVADITLVGTMVEWARIGRQRHWSHIYRDKIALGFATFVALEGDALEIRIVQSQVFPGLLQIEAYARAVLSSFVASKESIEPLVELRLRRQQAVLGSESGCRLIHFIFDQAILYRAVGGSYTLQEQLRNLINVANRPDVKLQVLPFEAGAAAALVTPFVILDFSDLAPSALWIEDPFAGDFVDQPPAIDRYRSIFDQLQTLALSEEDSIKIVEKAMR
jgi:transcriptional regulator with XRE-family HTH domain